MKKIIFIFIVLLSMTTVAYAEDEVDVLKPKVVQSIPGGVGTPAPLHNNSPFTFWAGGREWFVHFNDDIISRKYTGFVNCVDRKKKETQELVMDDGRMFLYCKPVKKEN